MKLASSCHFEVGEIYNVSTKDRFFTLLRFDLNDNKNCQKVKNHYI
ncbi:hypothetical protein [Chryseobacterium mucoviscidosis]